MFLIKIALSKIPKIQMNWKSIYTQSLIKKFEIIDENNLIQQVSVKATQNRPPKPLPPQEPEPYECCGSGCQQCVLDIYYSNLEKYERQLQEWIDVHGDLDDEDQF